MPRRSVSVANNYGKYQELLDSSHRCHGFSRINSVRICEIREKKSVILMIHKKVLYISLNTSFQGISQITRIFTD